MSDPLIPRGLFLCRARFPLSCLQSILSAIIKLLGAVLSSRSQFNPLLAATLILLLSYLSTFIR